MASSSLGAGHNPEELSMSLHRVPAAVRKQLGDEGTFGLIELLDGEQKNWSAHVLATATDRFDVRLTQETGVLRREMHASFENVRADVAAAKVEILRWSFLFWIGQVAAIAALMSLMLRAAGR
jgi:hypothetical protein